MDVTLNGVNSTTYISEASSVITIISGSSAEITLQGKNIVESSYDHAGVEVAEDGTLTITKDSTGSLDAFGGQNAAGIGGEVYVKPDAEIDLSKRNIRLEYLAG